MTKYESLGRQRLIKKPEGPHPIWRGIGCITIIMIPLISYGLAMAFVDIGKKAGWPIPYQLLGTPQFPDWAWKISSLSPLVRSLSTVPDLYANLFISVVFMVILGGLSSFAYALVYRFIGPSRYGPQDAPPPKGTKLKRYKR